MKALILSGGTGTRLRPFSYSMPKQLMPIANRPVLLRCLDQIREAGITDVGLVVGSWADEIMAVVGDGADMGLHVTYIHQDSPRGLAHCVQIACDFLRGEDFIMYLGDNVLLGGIEEFVAQFRANRPDVQVLVAKVDDPAEYGVAEIDTDSNLLRIVEKPSKPSSDLAVLGVYFFTAAIQRAVQAVTPSWRGEYEITDAIQWLIEHGGRVRAQVFSGYWQDTGRIRDVLDCNRAVLDTVAARVDGDIDSDSTLVGPVVVEKGARVVRSVVIGPAAIGAGSVLENSRVGPHTSVGRDCVLSGTSIADSIVLDGASIHHVCGVGGSLIGRSAVVRSGTDERHMLVVGDHARVGFSA